jgi:UDP-GlcNAc:undecaprenyl-phosphate GlcNAc-1-phosphate transferase
MFDTLKQSNVLWSAAILGGSTLISAVLVAVVRIVAIKLQFTDRPNRNTQNAGGAAMGGGIAIVATVLVMLYLTGGGSSMPWRIIAMMAALCILGLVDDVVRISPLAKVIGQIGCAAIYAVGEPFGAGAIGLALLFLMLSSNAWNVVDVMDSLLAAIGAIAMFGAGVVMLVHGAGPGGLPAIAMIGSGALLGFLFWNRAPAKIIMGDAGSLAMGMLFGVLVIEAAGVSALLALAVFLPGIVPFLEVAFLIVQRSRQGTPFYHSTPDHFALRMLHNGYSVAQIVNPVSLIGIGLAALACILVWTSFHTLLVTMAASILAVALVWAYRFLIRLRVGGTAR